jgi:hypothetical protein
MNSTLESMLNATSRARAAGIEPEKSRSVHWPAFGSTLPERPRFNYPWSDDHRDATPPGFGFAQRGIPSSPLHDV